MSTDPAAVRPAPIAPPSRHQLALMIWLAVLPTLTVLNLALSGVLQGAPVVLRTFVLATIAVPIVMYGLMPRLHRIRGRLVTRRSASRRRQGRGDRAVACSAALGPEADHG
jgi:antibiotic biosynthesis monooxygenase (ABM) superfamily enzyme